MEAHFYSLQLPERWAWISIGDISNKIQYGSSEKATNDSSGIPVIRMGNILEGKIIYDNLKYFKHNSHDLDELLLEEGDVLFNRTNSPELVGKTAVYKSNHPKAVFASYLIRIKTKNIFYNPDFLSFFINSIYGREYIKLVVSQQVGQANVNGTKLAAMPIPLAPLAEQHRIIARVEELFSRLDSGVEALQKAKAQLRRYRQAVLKAAVEGKLTEEWRKAHLNTEPASVLIERCEVVQKKARIRRRIKTSLLDVSDLATLPDGWEWARAEQVSDFITKGTTPKSENLHDGSGDIPFIKVYNLRFDGTLDFSIKPTFVSWETHLKELARSSVLPRDVLINIVGPPLGKVSIVPNHYPEWNINQAIARFRPIGCCDSEFLSIALQTESVLNWAKSRSKATAGQFNLTLEICRELPIPVPPKAEQKEIVLRVNRDILGAEFLKSEIEENLKRTVLLRQSILRRAFEGSLIPQDPSDEPASMLLERIKAEKTKEPTGRGRRNNSNQIRLIQ